MEELQLNFCDKKGIRCVGCPKIHDSSRTLQNPKTIKLLQTAPEFGPIDSQAFSHPKRKAKEGDKIEPSPSPPQLPPLQKHTHTRKKRRKPLQHPPTARRPTPRIQAASCPAGGGSEEAGPAAPATSAPLEQPPPGHRWTEEPGRAIWAARSA